MRTASILITGVLAAVAASVAYAQTTPTIVTPSQLKWSTSGMPKGAAWTTVAGNPNGNGWYVQRLKLSPGASFPPHTHGKAEMVTVLSGTLWAGIGKTFDKSKMKAFPTGTFVLMPAGVPHYVMAKDAVLIEISGMGPSTTNMIGGGSMHM